jgi:dCTP deaminase
MSIQSDRWIRRMSLEHGMIEPFCERSDGGGVISFGLSSYGYDVRVGRHFKVFTNVYGSVVDPKQFDEKAFVDVEADVCVVPPNSFALANTVEYFRIPDDVLTICVGKSTYARCFSADTRVALVDGTAPTLEAMAARAERGESFFGYALSEFGRIVVAQLEAPRFIGRDALLELTLDSGETIRCTPDHEFIRRDGTRCPADSLRQGESLMPLYRNVVRGYEVVYQPLNGHLLGTHRLADEWNVRHGVYAEDEGAHRHHHDRDRRNNSPLNIRRMGASDHSRLQNETNYGDDFDPVEHGAAIRAALEANAADPEWRESYRRLQSGRAKSFWSDPRYEATRNELLRRRREDWSDETRERQAAAQRARYQDPEERTRHAERMRRAWTRDPDRRRKQAEVARHIGMRTEIDAHAVRAALQETGSIRGAARLLGVDRSVFRRFRDVVAEARGRSRVRNHKVVSIRPLAGDHDVYCLTVPECGNFALEAGVFVSNCGIIVNVTPFEPGWEGTVTLEISNTTPLPARIYANEGLAQVLFFRGEERCETSYADRAGKYQRQTGITLPRVR